MTNKDVPDFRDFSEPPQNGVHLAAVRLEAGLPRIRSSRHIAAGVVAGDDHQRGERHPVSAGFPELGQQVLEFGVAFDTADSDPGISRRGSRCIAQRGVGCVHRMFAAVAHQNHVSRRIQLSEDAGSSAVIIGIRQQRIAEAQPFKLTGAIRQLCSGDPVFVARDDSVV